MNLLAPISSIMTTNLITMSPDDDLQKLNDVFAENRIHHVPVVDKGELVGIISKSDFLAFKRGSIDTLKPDVYEEIRMVKYKAKDIMTTKMAKLETSDRINVAVEVFKENRLHALPIVEGSHLKGIVTTHDIITHLAEDKEIVKEYN